MNIDLTLIFAAIRTAKELYEFALKAAEEAKRKGELTPEQEAQLDADIDSLPAREHWKVVAPDA